MHIAAAQQVPVVALFGPTSTKLYGPYHTPHQIIQPDSDCIMCGTGECKSGKSLIKHISPEKVYQAIRAFISLN
jgi:heptosyltransferase-2